MIAGCERCSQPPRLSLLVKLVVKICSLAAVGIDPFHLTAELREVDRPHDLVRQSLIVAISKIRNTLAIDIANKRDATIVAAEWRAAQQQSMDSRLEGVAQRL